MGAGNEGLAGLDLAVLKWYRTVHVPNPWRPSTGVTRRIPEADRLVHCKQRDALRMFLHENGIGTLVHYPVPVHLQPAYRDIAVPLGGLHKSEEAATQVLSLPMYAKLSPVQIHSVTEAILTWDRDHRPSPPRPAHSE